MAGRYAENLDTEKLSCCVHNNNPVLLGFRSRSIASLSLYADDRFALIADLIALISAGHALGHAESF
jgi:hypothetical protein